MNKFNSTTLLLLLSFIGNTQNKIPNYTKEFSFKTENDAYLFNLNDSYYTNGFILNYAFMKNQKEKKKIQSIAE